MEAFFTKLESSVDVGLPFRSISEITFVGITPQSVEVHTAEGERIRITNPDFITGLEITIWKKDLTNE